MIIIPNWNWLLPLALNWVQSDSWGYCMGASLAFGSIFLTTSAMWSSKVGSPGPAGVPSGFIDLNFVRRSISKLGPAWSSPLSIASWNFVQLTNVALFASESNLSDDLNKFLNLSRNSLNFVQVIEVRCIKQLIWILKIVLCQIWSQGNISHQILNLCKTSIDIP